MEKSEYKNLYNIEKNHWWYQGRLKLVKNFLPRNGNGLKLLDLGCGTGLVALDLSKKGYDSYGLDVMDEAIKYCNLRGLKNVVKGSILKIPFKENSFDIATCIDVIYHEYVTDDVKSLKEIFRILKPGGRLVLTTCATKSLAGRHDKFVHTRQRYESRELSIKLRKAGFKIRKLSYFNTFLFPLIYITRKIDNFINQNKASESDIGKVNPVVSFLLKNIFFAEVNLLKHLNFPFGVSLIAVAEKPK
ncbi:MAG: class I SAM-dependent methyltransferase [Nanoarchaeota archaeon]|nr:class I SAM-dependent methyltransferase [Nanoarchaeota archaeon]